MIPLAANNANNTIQSQPVKFSTRKHHSKLVFEPVGRLRQRRLFRPDETDGCL